ncbi:hypothetical protein ACFL13_03090, partial [Patescibacteria group bacterium]
LVDFNYGMDAYKKTDLELPILFASEKSGYVDTERGRVTEIAYTAGDLRNLGASGVKLLIYFNPGDESSKIQIQVAKKVLEDAHENGLPLFLEIVHYDMEPQVPESVSLFLDSGVNADVFKLEFPGNLKKAEEVTQALGNIPWILLTRGVDFDEFKERLSLCVEGGCRGFLAGRALWKELPTLKTEKEVVDFLENTLPKRFKEISQICSPH